MIGYPFGSAPVTPPSSSSPTSAQIAVQNYLTHLTEMTTAVIQFKTLFVAALDKELSKQSAVAYQPRFTIQVESILLESLSKAFNVLPVNRLYDQCRFSTLSSIIASSANDKCIRNACLVYQRLFNPTAPSQPKEIPWLTYAHHFCDDGGTFDRTTLLTKFVEEATQTLLAAEYPGWDMGPICIQCPTTKEEDGDDIDIEDRLGVWTVTLPVSFERAVVACRAAAIPTTSSSAVSHTPCFATSTFDAEIV